MTKPGGEARWRVGLVGAGAISEYHARAIRRVRNAELVGIADRDLGRARAMAERWRIPQVCGSMEELCETSPDVVHVLTAPSSHAAVALRALENGSHVYVEKPCAATVEECDQLTVAAARADRVIGVGHSLLRDPSVLYAQTLVHRGVIGDLFAVDYVRSQPISPGPGPLQPYTREGGFPFRDVGIHGVYLVEAFLGSIESVQTQIASTGLNPFPYCDDWQVLLRCARGSARIHLSSVLRPWQSTLTLLGTCGSIRADLFASTVTARRAYTGPAPLVRMVNSGAEALQLAWQATATTLATACGRLRRFHGVQDLIVEFYRDLEEGREPAVTPAGARASMRWTETIARDGDCRQAAWASTFTERPRADILVTGAGGMVGRRLVERLVENSYRVRALVRREPPAGWHDDPNIEVMLGDLGDPEAVDRAVAGTRTVFHVGAAMRGAPEEFERGTVLGTRHVVDAALAHGVDRFVHVSSLSVLHASAFTGVPVDERWPLEPRADARGHYTRSKLAAERIVTHAVQQLGLRAVLLRPGEIIRDRSMLLTSGVAHRLGRVLIVLGDGSLYVPLVALEDVIDALLAAAERGPFDGSVVHLVDSEPVTQRILLECVRSTMPGRLRVVRVPRPIVLALSMTSEWLFRVIGVTSPFSRYRVASALAPRAFSCARAAALLGWTPRLGVRALLGERAPQVCADLGIKAAP